MHQLTKVPVGDNPNSPFLTPRAANQIQRFPLMAIGTLDSQSRPWCSLWGGETPFAQPVAQSIIGIRTTVDSSYDPVIEAIFHGKDDGEVIKEQGRGRMIAGLSISLEERNRVKLYGRMIAGALGAIGEQSGQDGGERDGKIRQASENASQKDGKVGQVQLVVRIEQSLSNCPKYLNSKRIDPVIPSPKLISDSVHLPPQAVSLLEKADTFFISSADGDNDMDLNHRGGPRGFVRLASNADSTQDGTRSEETVIAWPEYSGNNLYQTLGNLLSTPRAGLCIPDFETGDVLYLTGTTEVLIGNDANQFLPHSNLAVRLKVSAARFVQSGLPFRGTELAVAGGGASPYNPRVRHLKTERPADLAADDTSGVTAKLIKSTKLTPTINRYRFTLSDPLALGPWKPGQYVALSFYDELYMGYEHMRNDDPTSLNDDFLRTFTVSSRHATGLNGEEFEVTVRNVGAVTGWLARQRVERGVSVEVRVKGFGGDFVIRQHGGEKAVTPFIAAGIGITPLLAQVEDLDLRRLRLFWSVSVRDVGLVLDTFEGHPGLAGVTEVFLSGDLGRVVDGERKVEEVKQLAARCEMRRIQDTDLTSMMDEVDEWYLCTAPAFRKMVQEWLPGKQIVYENFDY